MPYKDPAKMAEYMRHRRASKTGKVNGLTLTQNVNPVNPNKTRKNKENQVNINPLTQSVNPVSLEKYLLSYSRNKYQFVLYSVDFSGRKSLIRSCKKNDILKLGPCEIVLTWGPDIEEALQ